MSLKNEYKNDNFKCLGTKLKKLQNIFDEYKSLRITVYTTDSSFKINLNIKFIWTGIYHLLGLNRLEHKNSDLDKETILKKVIKNSGNFYQKNIKRNKTLSSKHRNFILRKWKAFDIIFENINKPSFQDKIEVISITKNNMIKKDNLFIFLYKNILLETKVNYLDFTGYIPFCNLHTYSLKMEEINNLKNKDKYFLEISKKSKITKFKILETNLCKKQNFK